MRLTDEKRSTRPFEIGPRRVYPTLEAARARFRLVPPENRTAPYILDYVARHSLKEVEGGWTWKFDEHLIPKHDDVEGDGHPREDRSAGDVHLRRRQRDRVAQARARDRAATFRNARGPIAIPESHHHVLLDQPLSLVAALRAVLY